MNNKLQNKNVDFLFKAILALENTEECYDFFEDLEVCLDITFHSTFSLREAKELPVHLE